MMAGYLPFSFVVQVDLQDADSRELYEQTDRLLRELQELDIESVARVRSGNPPPGTKAGEALEWGQIAVVALPAILPFVIDLCKQWANRGKERKVRFKANIAGQDYDIEGTPEDLQRLLSLLTASS